MAHPKDIGDRTVLAVMMALDLAGLKILVPFGENLRYDLVVDDGMRLARVQCKTGRLRDGAVRFNTCSCYGHHRNPLTHRRSYVGQIDYFAVYCPQTDSVYLIPLGDAAPKSSATLRVDPPLNNQRRRVRFAADYEIANLRARRATGNATQLRLARTEPDATAGAR